MIKYFILLATLLASTISFGQSMYSTTTNRVVLSTIVNSDTILIENRKNNVRVNGNLDLVEIIYDNQDARIVGRTNQREDRSDIQIKFFNEYLWLDERIKTTERVLNFKEELKVEINGMEQIIPVDFIISRLRGGQGFNVLMEIHGNFSGEGLEEDFPDLIIDGDIAFGIYLTIQVTQ